MMLVTSACCNPMFRVPVTCGYSAERGYIVSKTPFLSTSADPERDRRCYYSIHIKSSLVGCFLYDQTTSKLMSSPSMVMSTSSA